MLNVLNTQAEKYKKLQGRIQKRTMPEALFVSNSGREGFTEMAREESALDEQFQSLVKEYQYVQSQLATASETYVNNLKSPYRNHFVSLSNGQQGYVTGENVFKPLSTGYGVVSGMSLPNGVGVNNNRQTGQVLEGSVPPMLVGTELEKGRSFAPTGQNIWVAETIGQGGKPPEFLGCYSTEPEGEPMTADQCIRQAEQNAYQYIGMGKIDQVNQVMCGLSNVLNTFTQGGQLPKYEAVECWTSNTEGVGNYAIFTFDGVLQVCSPNGEVLWSQSSSFSQCIEGGGINQINATYGGNCSVPSGNVTQIVRDARSASTEKNKAVSSLVFAVNNATLGDPAPGCPKAWDTSYQCGNEVKTAHLNYGEGQNFLYDCTQQVQTCQDLRLELQGGVAQFRLGSQIKIWKSFALDATNPEWEASKGKTAYPYLLPSQTLFSNESIGNLEGTMRLVMRASGELALETAKQVSQDEENCSATKVYQRPEGALGNPELIQHMGFVDEDAVLHEYPADLLTLGKEFQAYPQMTCQGEDVDGAQPISASSLEEIKAQCLSRPDCGGFVYDQVGQRGWLKSTKLTSRLLSPSTQASTYIRIPLPTGGCGRMPISAVDSLSYSLFAKGEEMSENSQCGMAKTLQPLQKQLREISQKLRQVSEKMKQKIQKNAQRTSNNEQFFDSNTQVMASNLAKNADIQREIAQWLGEESGEKIEGFEARGLTNQDIQATYQDALLHTNQMTDTYYLWVFGAFFVIGASWWYLRRKKAD